MWTLWRILWGKPRSRLGFCYLDKSNTFLLSNAIVASPFCRYISPLPSSMIGFFFFFISIVSFLDTSHHSCLLQASLTLQSKLKPHLHPTYPSCHFDRATPRSQSHPSSHIASSSVRPLLFIPWWRRSLYLTELRPSILESSPHVLHTESSKQRQISSQLLKRKIRESEMCGSLRALRYESCSRTWR